MSKKKRPLRPEHVFRKIALAILGAVVALIIVTLVYSSSSATITVKVSNKAIAQDFVVAVKDVPIRNGFVAKKKEVSQEITQEFPSSFVRTDEPTLATGTVTIINNSGITQPLVKRTRFLSEDGILFRLREAVVVPANGKVTANVEADKPGREGEIDASDFTIPGLAKSRQTEVFATSDSSMTGGTKFIYKIKEEDIRSAELAVQEQAKKQGILALKETLNDNEIMLGNKVFTSIKAKEIDAQVGDEKEKFNVSATVLVIAFSVKEDDLYAFFRKRLEEQLGNGAKLVSFDKDKTTYTIEQFDTDNQIITLNVHAVGSANVSSEAQVLDRKKFMGLSANEVKKQLESFDGIQSANVKLWPLWVRKVPRLESKIFIRIDK